MILGMLCEFSSLKCTFHFEKISDNQRVNRENSSVQKAIHGNQSAIIFHCSASRSALLRKVWWTIDFNKIIYTWFDILLLLQECSVRVQPSQTWMELIILDPQVFENVSVWWISLKVRFFSWHVWQMLSSLCT